MNDAVRADPRHQSRMVLRRPLTAAERTACRQAIDRHARRVLTMSPIQKRINRW